MFWRLFQKSVKSVELEIGGQRIDKHYGQGGLAPPLEFERIYPKFGKASGKLAWAMSEPKWTVNKFMI